MVIAIFVFAPIVCYLLGSIPFGLILCKLIKNVDIREQGSKNIGATNAGRVCGWPFFVATFALDFCKGLGAVFLYDLLVGLAGGQAVGDVADMMRVFCGLCAILGHVFPVTLRFKGGKAVATSFGVFIALAPLAAALAFAVWLLVFRLFRYVSLASILAAVAAPGAYVGQYWGALGDHLPVFGFTLAVALLVVIRHRSNIKRLLAGTEPRFVRKKT